MQRRHFPNEVYGECELSEVRQTVNASKNLFGSETQKQVSQIYQLSASKLANNEDDVRETYLRRGESKPLGKKIANVSSGAFAWSQTKKKTTHSLKKQLKIAPQNILYEAETENTVRTKHNLQI